MDATLSCTVNIEWLDKLGGIVKTKYSERNAQVRLTRNGDKQLYVEVLAPKAATIRLPVENISVHKKFMNEGKSSINFPKIFAMMYMSNAPTNQLFAFLKTLFFKVMNISRTGKPTSSILSDKKNTFDEISPITTAEMVKAKAKISRGTATTPSPLSLKRKREEMEAVPAPTLELDPEQKIVLDACLAGKNVFFTGSAGTGKSFLLKKILGAFPPDVTVATASTGVAACHIGGMTLHRFAALSPSIMEQSSSLEDAIKKVCKSNHATSLMRKCKHLIIDEISMVDGQYFNAIEALARHARRNEKPFGGIQLILCGDFFQLPPIGKPKSSGQNDKVVSFAFQTDAWKACKLNVHLLVKVHRQTDQHFVKILNKIRKGVVDEEVISTLKATSKQRIERDGILATTLCSHTNQADDINNSKLKALKTEPKLFNAHDSGNSQLLDQQTQVPSSLTLKVGAQVMLLRNINVSKGLVNGARGVIKEFRNGLPVVQFRNKREYHVKTEKFYVLTPLGETSIRTQVPLKLAWAFSIHKSQGLTLDCVEMSLERVFESGQAYVALSRAKSLDSLRVLDFKADQVWANPDVLKFYNRLMDHEQTYIPLGVSNKPKAKVRLF